MKINKQTSKAQFSKHDKRKRRHRVKILINIGICGTYTSQEIKKGCDIPCGDVIWRQKAQKVTR